MDIVDVIVEILEHGDKFIKSYNVNVINYIQISDIGGVTSAQQFVKHYHPTTVEAFWLTELGFENSLLKPKSVSTICPSQSSRIFSSLMSR